MNRFLVTFKRFDSEGEQLASGYLCPHGWEYSEPEGPDTQWTLRELTDAFGGYLAEPSCYPLPSKPDSATPYLWMTVYGDSHPYTGERMNYGIHPVKGSVTPPSWLRVLRALTLRTF